MSFVSPTEDELAAVMRLKERIINEFPEGINRFTDTAILRFLRGRKHDEDKAFKALQKHIEWRNEYHVDEIMNHKDQFQNELHTGKFNVEYKDKDGTPTIYIFAGKHDKNHRDLEELRLLIIYTLEMILKRAKPEEERMVIAFDLSGFTLACMDYEVLKMLINILQFNYPDTLRVALVINAPFLFSACWAIIRPWLDPVTAAKAMFIKKEQLEDYFDLDAIPAELK